MTDDEVRRRGLDALTRELGPVDMARFLKQFRTPPGCDADVQKQLDGGGTAATAAQRQAAASDSPPQPAVREFSPRADDVVRANLPAEAPIAQQPAASVDPTLDTPRGSSHFLARWLGSRGFLLAGLIAAPVLLLLALFLPQLPRLRAVRAVEARGGEVSFYGTLPGWLYELCGARIECLEPVSEIHLDGAGVDDRFMPNLRWMNKSHIVWLNKARITDTGAATLLEFQDITSLDLGDTAVTEALLVRLLQQNRQLETIWLEGTAAGDATLEALRGTATLQDLTLARTRITDQGLAHLAALPALEDLELSETSVGDAGMSILSTCPVLTDLTLNETHVSDAGLEHLARLPALEQLAMTGTSIRGTGLAFLKRAPHLSRLYLDRTQVGDEGLEHVAAMKSLTAISLAGTRVTDAGLAKLAGATQLSQIYIGGAPVTPEGVRRLRQALPVCTIDESIEGVELPSY